MLALRAPVAAEGLWDLIFAVKVLPFPTDHHIVNPEGRAGEAEA